MKKVFIYLILLLTLSTLLIFPTYCADGVLLGIKLFINSLLPAILPFIIFSNFIIRLDYSKQLGKFFYPITHTLFGVSHEGSYAVIMGFLCGYPVGAKITSDLYLRGNICKNEAEYLFKFVNHASPAFIQGYIVLSLLKLPEFRIAALILIYLPEIITGIIFRKKQSYPNNLGTNEACDYPISKILDDSLSDAIITISKVGGYLIIFSTAAAVIMKAYFLPLSLKTLLVSTLEITSGTYYIFMLQLPSVNKLFLCILACLFGGLSSFFQVNSVVRKAGFRKRDYFYSKMISAVILTLLFFIMVKIFL